MADRNKHPNKEIEAALRHAEANGWTVKSNRSHWGVMLCPTNDGGCGCKDHCITSINSTPQNPSNHARNLSRVVDRCVAARQKASQNKDDQGEENV